MTIQIAEDGELVRRIDALGRDLETYLSEPLWYQREHGRDGARSIAYFSAEYGITSVLPQYSGGLGILAGDHLKTASDMGVPVVGVLPGLGSSMAVALLLPLTFALDPTAAFIMFAGVYFGGMFGDLARAAGDDLNGGL